MRLIPLILSYALAVSLHAQTPQASSATERSTNASPATPEQLQQAFELNEEAKTLMASGNYSEAAKILSQAVRLNPASAQAWNDRAIAEIRLKSYADAVYDSSFALGLAPGNETALDTRAWAFNKLQKYREALSDSGFVLAKNASDAFGYENRSFSLAGLGDSTGSLTALAEAASLDSRFKDIYARALAVGPEEILSVFEDAPKGGTSQTSWIRWWKKRTFLSLMILSLIGGILVALGILHVFFYRLDVLKKPSSKLGRAGNFWSRYEKIARAGSGGMGVVYEARDRFLERKVAVKKLRDEIKNDPEERQRFISEARLVASLHHPHIVEIYSIVEEDSDLYIVFEFVKGRTLQKILEENKALRFSYACQVLRAVCKAVDYAHRKGVVHRDIKPSNIMIGDEGIVKVMDFGVARQAKVTLARTQTNVFAGTPTYMAPEADGEIPRRESDIFSLAVCLFEMLSGRLPFEGEGTAMILNKARGRHLRFSTLHIPGTPLSLDLIFDKALTPDPDHRYHSAAEFWAALTALEPQI